MCQPRCRHPDDVAACFKKRHEQYAESVRARILAYSIRTRRLSDQPNRSLALGSLIAKVLELRQVLKQDLDLAGAIANIQPAAKSAREYGHD